MSLDFQRDIGIGRAKELGFEPKLWNEGGKSSNHEEIDKRPILSQLLAAIQGGVVKHLYVYDQSRLSRNDYVSSLFRFQCQKHGVTLYNKEGKYDLANPQDQFLKQILDAVGQFDNSQRAERTRLGKLARVKQGCWLGGPPPFGYLIENRKLAINPKESVWVERIFEAYASNTSTMDIKVMLDANGVVPRRKGASWSLGSLQALMRNTHYIGYSDFRDGRSGEEVRVDCPRILSSELWQRVQKTKAFHVEKRHAMNPVKHFYMLRGLMKCGHCGTLLGGIISESQKKHHYYCPKKERLWTKQQLSEEEKWKRGRVCTMTRSLSIPETDALVWGAVLEVLSKSTLLKEKVRTEVLGIDLKNLRVGDDEIKKIQNKIKSLKKEQKTVITAFANIETERVLQTLSPDEYPKIRENITRKKISLEADIEVLESTLLGISQNKRWLDWLAKFKNQIDSYESFDQERKRELLQGVLTSIDVHLEPNQTHRLVLNLQLPLVGDHLEFINPRKKSDGYRVVEGANSLELVSIPGKRTKKNRIDSIG